MLSEAQLVRKDPAAVKAEVVAAISALSLPAMDVSVQVDPRGLTGTKVVGTLKRSEARGEGPLPAAPSAP